jgi:hypothetical protein
MKITRHHTFTDSTPFSNHHVQRLFKKYIQKVCDFDIDMGVNLDSLVRIIDPFARAYRQPGCFTLTNDLNPAFQTDYCMEANDFCEMLAAGLGPHVAEFDLIYFDPPYTLRKLKDLYDGIGKDLEIWQTHNMWGRARGALARCIRIGGYAISFGYNTRGFGRRLGFDIEEIMILHSAGRPDRYDILVTVERKVQHGLDIECE